MNWGDLVPLGVAASQVAWERRRAIRRMRALGFTYEDIGIRFGISTSNAGTKGRRRDSRTSPVEHWMNDNSYLADIVQATRGAVFRYETSPTPEQREKILAGRVDRLRHGVANAERALLLARQRLAFAVAELDQAANRP